MRIYKIWAKHEEVMESMEIISLDPLQRELVRREFKFYGGSNDSYEDALQKAKLKSQIVKSKIDGNFNYRKDLDYEVDIKEEVIAELNENNIITRNRYGALVLNTTEVMFIDIDEEDFKFFYGFKFPLLKLYHFFKGYTLEQKIESHINYKAKLLCFKNVYFRVYRTPKGYRVAVLGKDIQANSDYAGWVFSQFNSDYLYSELCKKQNCYRARITPKPWRIGVKKLKIIFPLRSEEEDRVQEEWVSNYRKKSNDYASCKYLYDKGKPVESKVIHYHDRFCKAHSNLPLA